MYINFLAKILLGVTMKSRVQARKLALDLYVLNLYIKIWYVYITNMFISLLNGL